MSLADITDRIAAACGKAGREPKDVALVAVSKKQPESRVVEVLEQGHRVFGENRVQEAQERWTPLRERFDGISLHLVGPLQSNKARAAMQLFDAIHSVDRVKLAETLARIADELGSCPEVFVQVNTGEEPQKSGVVPDDTDALVARCRELSLPIRGLMCIPPLDETPSLHFALLAKLAARNGLPALSMGMSGDFEEAIRHGATHVRVGSAIFGERPG